MNNQRLPPAQRAELPEGAVWKGRAEDTRQMAWLYETDLEKVVGEWVQGRQQKE